MTTFTHSGYACRVVRMEDGIDYGVSNGYPSYWFCGYVQLPEQHAWYDVTYNEITDIVRRFTDIPEMTWFSNGEVGFDILHPYCWDLTYYDVCQLTRQLAEILESYENTPIDDALSVV
jgi:hypothetical protein